MRLASLFVLLLMASLLCAQEAPSAPPPPAEPQAAPAPAAQPAPQLGHPLDPADVATLTGRAATSVPAYARTSTYYYPPYAGGYPASVPMFSDSQFAGNWAMPMFSPFPFGGGNLFVFHHRFGPPLFGTGFIGFRGGHHGGSRHR